MPFPAMHHSHCPLSILHLFQGLRKRNEGLEAQVSELQAKLVASSEGKRINSEQFQELHSQLGDAIRQLSTVHQKMAKNASIDI